MFFSASSKARKVSISPNTEAVSASGKEGGAAPIRRYRHNGEAQNFRHVVFDDFVLPEETERHPPAGDARHVRAQGRDRPDTVEKP